MMRVSVAMMAAAGAMLGATVAFADEEKVGDYTWSYRIANGEAEIYKENACAIGPSPVGDIQIPARLGGCPVTALGSAALANSALMTGVTMPKSVRTIGERAFIASAISNVTFSPVTTSIGELAFAYCDSLTKLVLPDNVVDIALGSFNGCKGLTNVTVGAGTTNIGRTAFRGCSSLAKVRMPRSLEAAVNANGTIFGTIFGGCPSSLEIEYYDVTVVTLNANGGENGGKVQLRKGGTLEGRVLPAATRVGYAFAGWWTKKSGGKKLSTKTKFAKGATYYAHWTPRKYPVKLTKSGKGSVSGGGSRKYRSKVTVKAKAADGYVFQGWYRIANGEEGIVNSVIVSQKAAYSFKVPLGGVTLKANFITKAQDKAAIGMTLDGTGVGASAAGAGAMLPTLTNMCGVALSVPLTAAGLTPVKVTAKNLPTGLKYDAKKKAIVGAPRSAKTFNVKFTVKSAGASRTWSVKWVIKPLPDRAKGRFVTGLLHLFNGKSYVFNPTLAVTSSGKISGKFQEYGTNWTLSASCYSTYEANYINGELEEVFKAAVTATYAYKVTKKVKGKKKKVTKYLKRAFEFLVSIETDELTAMICDESLSPSYLSHNLWEVNAAFAALGKKYFYTSKKKKYRTFKIAGGSESGTAMGLDQAETLTLKITPSGDVTAVMAFDTGRKAKDKKTGKMEKVIYKATCTTILLPLKKEEDGSTRTAVLLYFAPNEAYGYPGYRNTFDSSADIWYLKFWPGGKFVVYNDGLGG